MRPSSTSCSTIAAVKVFVTLAIANGVSPLSGVTPSRGRPEAPLHPIWASAEMPTATAPRPNAARARSTAASSAAASAAETGSSSTGRAVPPPSCGCVSNGSGSSLPAGPVASGDPPGVAPVPGSEAPGSGSPGRVFGERVMETITATASRAAAPVRRAIGRRIGREAWRIGAPAVGGAGVCSIPGDAPAGPWLHRRAPPKLPPLLDRPDREPGRHLDADGLPAMAGAPAGRHLHPARHRGRAPVRALARARAARRRAGRSGRQAPPADGHPVGGRPPGGRALWPDRDRSGPDLAHHAAGPGARLRERARHAGPPVLCRRPRPARGPDERHHPELGVLQPGPRGRSGGGRDHARDLRSRLQLRGQCGQLPRRADRPAAHGSGGHAAHLAPR